MNRMLTFSGAGKAFFKRLVAALPLALACMAPAHSDPARGHDLYFSNHCFDCHGADPSAKAGATIAMLKHAIATEPAMHGVDSIANLTDGEIADIIDYLSAPGTLPQPVLSPATLAFPATKSGEVSAPLVATLSNQGNAPLPVSAVFVGGDNSDDFTVGGTCTEVSALAPHASCTVSIVFQPTGVGPRTAAVYISHRKVGDRIGASSELDVSGTGTGTPRPTVGLFSTDVSFGDVVVNSASYPFDLVVNNKGQATLVFNGITVDGTDAAAISRSGDCAVGLGLEPGASCTVTLSVQPAHLGNVFAKLTLSSNASNGTVVVPITANGVPVPVPKMEADSASLAFGMAAIGGAAMRQQTVFTNTGNVGLSVNTPALSGSADFAIDSATDCGYWLPVGASCTVIVSYQPRASGAANGTLTVSSEAGDIKIDVSGTGTTTAVGRATLSAGTLSFALTQVGNASAPQTLTISNIGTAAFKIGTIGFNGASRYDYSFDGTCAPNYTVNPGSNCFVNVVFRPGAAGARNARLDISTDTGARLGVSLSGSANAIAVPGTSVVVQPPNYGFPQVLVGNPSPQKRFTLVNTGSDPVQMVAADITGPFQIVTTEGGCPSMPFVLQPGTACDITVSFTPTVGGSVTGGINLRTQDASQHWIINLSGDAVMPNQRQNSGGGGCSSITSGKDPMLAFLVVLSVCVLAYRRRQSKGLVR